MIHSYQPDTKNRKIAGEDNKINDSTQLGLNIIDNTDPIMDAELMTIDFNEVFKKLEKDLPPMPDPYVNESQNPPPYTQAKSIIGVPPPKAPLEKRAGANKAAPKTSKKKDGKLEKPIQWAGMPKPDPKSSQDVIAEYNNNLDDEKETEDLQSGVMSDIEVKPAIIREVRDLLLCIASYFNY